jgi:hypothetical protein
MRNELQEERVLDMAVLQAHKEKRFPVELKYYGEESPMLVNVVPCGTNLKTNEEIGKSMGDRFAIKF